LEKEFKMTSSFSKTAGRSLALVTVVGASLTLGLFSQASAQTAATPKEGGKPPAAAAATSNKPETVEQRITTLKTALKITPDQESKWDGVAKAMRENAAAMDKLVQEKHGKMANMNAVDDLNTYQDFSQANLDGLKNLISSFKTLYDSMPADQKKNADGVFDSYGPKPTQRG
jgi:periplasmic protein CpxP/Spy